jgi:hypothetical protein
MTKAYFRESGVNIVEINMDVVLGDALLELVDSGIDEGTHFWGSLFRDLDDDDFETAINNPGTQARMIEYVRLPLIEKMKKVLAERREETARHKKET